MGIMEWGGLGALLLGIIMFCARIMRNGLTSLDDHRSQYLEKMHQEEKKLNEDKKNIAAQEHMTVIYSAVKDLLRLDNNPPGYSVKSEKQKIILTTPQGEWQIELLMRERRLKGSRKILHGRGKWLLSGFGVREDHLEVAGVMRSLNRHLHPDSDTGDQPENDKPAQSHGIVNNFDVSEDRAI